MDSLEKVLNDLFGADDGGGRKRFLDVQKIPRICEDIEGINQKMTEIRSDVSIIKKIVYGAVTLILLGFASLAYKAIEQLIK